MKNYDKFKFIADKLKKQQEKNKQKKKSDSSPVKKNNANANKKVPKKPVKKTNKKETIKPNKATPVVTIEDKLNNIETLKVPEMTSKAKRSVWEIITGFFK